MSERYKGTHRITRSMRKLSELLDGAWPAVRFDPEVQRGELLRATYTVERIRREPGRRHRLVAWTNRRGIEFVSLDTTHGTVTLGTPEDFPAEHPRARSEYYHLIRYLDHLLVRKSAEGRRITYHLKEYGA